ncbi:hypothetical protein Q5762_08840 [Streptomyces sp. P9(2023)]|uniref:hypothetical protein n=1 Tax=Streptomyces sp. P9(2023) TaxID=3064394 RepID=UPI0028F3EE6D|nr:hypothetical protein [Streptomyces sp. P9(2023)]MDT9688457.1 hypothetical protein [Streptomyces sp. P9(2023)]
MISEPELEGGDGFPAGRLLAPETVERDVSRPPRPWLWALGGAVVASAVWAGGLYAYERSREGGPDLAGYRTVTDLCARAELKGLAGVLGVKSADVGTFSENHAALDTAECSATLGPPETGYRVSLTYRLHKVTDPEPEFEARYEGSAYGEFERVDGLGETAFFLLHPADEGAEMAVLDGQVELELSLSKRNAWDEDAGEEKAAVGRVDLSGIDTVLAQDLTALMAALKK